MNFSGFKDWLMTCLLIASTYILWDMKSSVEKLNTQVAVVLEKAAQFEKYNDQQDRRIEKIEDQLKKERR